MALRIPTVRRRFVARARTLQGDRPFQKAIEAARDTWNRDYAEYAVSPGPWRMSPSFWANAYVVPEPLERAYERINSGRSLEDEYPTASRAYRAWAGLVDGLCTTWWPPEDFPVWYLGAWIEHPCTRFVSGALVWHVRTVDAEWVAPYVLQVTRLDYNPAALHLSPAEAEARWNSLVRLLHEHVQNERHVTTEALATAISQAIEDGRQAAEYENSPVDVLYVFPGMRGEDWNALRDEHLAQDHKRLRARVRELTGSHSLNEVARRLGLSPKTVQRLEGK